MHEHVDNFVKLISFYLFGVWWKTSSVIERRLTTVDNQKFNYKKKLAMRINYANLIHLILPKVCERSAAKDLLVKGSASEQKRL